MDYLSFPPVLDTLDFFNNSSPLLLEQEEQESPDKSQDEENDRLQRLEKKISSLQAQILHEKQERTRLEQVVNYLMSLFGSLAGQQLPYITPEPTIESSIQDPNQFLIPPVAENALTNSIPNKRSSKQLLYPDNSDVEDVIATPIDDSQVKIYSNQAQPSSITSLTTAINSERDTQKTLPPSKSPIIDAFVYCALKNLGVSLIQNDSETIKFQINDWQILFENSAAIENKRTPTTDPICRVKALGRWFTNISRSPKELTPRTVEVRTDTKDDKLEKMRVIIDTIRKLIAYI